MGFLMARDSKDGGKWKMRKQKDFVGKLNDDLKILKEGTQSA